MCWYMNVVLCLHNDNLSFSLILGGLVTVTRDADSDKYIDSNIEYSISRCKLPRWRQVQCPWMLI